MSHAHTAAPANPQLLGGCSSPSDSVHALNTLPAYRLHPLVVFSILDHYQRRNQGQPRVVGTLLGSVEGSVVEIKQAFPVPHTEEEDTALVDMEYHVNMLSLTRQVSPRDVVIGWYSTSAGSSTGGDEKEKGEQTNYITSLIHEVYRGQVPSALNIEPIHLTVDVSMKGGMKLHGFINSVISVGGNNAIAKFEPVPIQIYAYEEEKIGVDALISGVPDDDARLDAPATCLSDIENIEAAMVKLLESVEVVESYVQRVSSGEIQGDAELAAAIHTALASLPHLDASTFSTIFATHIQDLLAIVYLANMTKNQLAIADKASVLS